MSIDKVDIQSRAEMMNSSHGCIYMGIQYEGCNGCLFTPDDSIRLDLFDMLDVTNDEQASASHTDLQQSNSAPPSSAAHPYPVPPSSPAPPPDRSGPSCVSKPCSGPLRPCCVIGTTPCVPAASPSPCPTTLYAPAASLAPPLAPLPRQPPLLRHPSPSDHPGCVNHPRPTNPNPFPIAVAASRSSAIAATRSSAVAVAATCSTLLLQGLSSPFDSCDAPADRAGPFSCRYVRYILIFYMATTHDCWKKAMVEELEALDDNHTWDIVN
ncbi:uncharacterized protein LOC131217423 [Magnolia sinica]|uniref:uncharacterized protein LOC131217423 n=1 Tax=Magnolia sinica TaxID=86752 RepID=UPI00265A92E8|nr:uncharacterized protein LOC131217423 [Magnolia sinica]